MRIELTAMLLPQSPKLAVHPDLDPIILAAAKHVSQWLIVGNCEVSRKFKPLYTNLISSWSTVMFVFRES